MNENINFDVWNVYKFVVHTHMDDSMMSDVLILLCFHQTYLFSVKFEQCGEVSMGKCAYVVVYLQEKRATEHRSCSNRMFAVHSTYRLIEKNAQNLHCIVEYYF